MTWQKITPKFGKMPSDVLSARLNPRGDLYLTRKLWQALGATKLKHYVEVEFDREKLAFRLTLVDGCAARGDGFLLNARPGRCARTCIHSVLVEFQYEVPKPSIRLEPRRDGKAFVFKLPRPKFFQPEPEATASEES